MKRYLSFFFTFLFFTLTNAQQPEKLDASEIYESIKKLNFLGSVLYIAAHPDDENTRLISYFSNDLKARTAYLSLTRGDGGQNLIGPELREFLGVIRTQELLAARRVDGGEQFFTRANDFGYSKHPDETLEIWNKEAVLKDVVSIIRKFKPDVIINRFNHRTPGSTHGHHTSSAMLSVDAFDLANDKNYETHMGSADLWKPTRLFFNTTWWFYGSKDKFAKADKSNMLSFDTGLFHPSSGLSNTEIASLSRSKHQSQGFGSTGARGSELEYIEFLKGSFPQDRTNIFDGIDTSWSRVVGGKAIKKITSSIEQNFDFKNPSASISELLKAHKQIKELKDAHWRDLKLKQIESIITACAGLYLEAAASESNSYPNSEISLKIEAINRSEISVKLKNVRINPLQITSNSEIDLQNNKRENFTLKGKIPSDIQYTNAYWLNKIGSLGMYAVEDEQLIGNAQTPRNITASFTIDFDGYTIDFERDVIYKFTNPVKGEVYQPFEILPEVTAGIANKVLIFADSKVKEVSVKVKAIKANLNGSVSLAYPKGWSVSPKAIDFTITQKGGEQIVNFMVTPPEHQSEGLLSPMVKIGDKIYVKELVEINYDHIPKQSVLVHAVSKIVRLDIKKKGQRIGYIQGAGDNIPESLRQIGYTVIELKGDQITVENLENFDAVILGIRAYNIDDRAKFYQKEIHKYVENGGTLLVQYNTSRRQKVAKVAPYELTLSRDRVTDENSEVIILEANHEVLNYPNKITTNDFNGWVQERGLYFPNKWAKEFTPLLSMHDKGESPKKGSLLIAKHGKGHFIYTGLSFFRELPAGVPGAYKLFANILSVGKNNTEKPIKN